MSNSFPLTTLPHVVQRRKRSTALQLAARKPLSSYEVAHVCHALLRIANHLQEQASTHIVSDLYTEDSTLDTLQENDHA